MNPEQTLTRESLAEGATIHTATRTATISDLIVIAGP